MLDGSSVRAAREAKGMTQAELAEKVGCSQQAIEKIELGKIKRTSYLPEINQVLGIERKQTVGEGLTMRRRQAGLSMDELARRMGFAGQSSIQRYLMPGYDLELRPDMARKFDDALGPSEQDMTGITPVIVLRTILCANPTAEQIMAALAANGFKIVSVETEVPITAVDDPLGFIQEILDRRHITATELARAVNIAPSTLNKKLAHPGASGLNASTLKKIADWDRYGAVDDPLTFVREVLHRHGISPGGLATLAGIAPSTLTRFLNDPNHKYTLSTVTLRKIREWDRSHGETQEADR